MRRVVVIVVALATLAGCASGGAPGPGPAATVTLPATVAVDKVAAPTPTPVVDLSVLPVADPWAVLPAAPVDPDPATMPSGLLVAPADAAGAPLYDAPSGTPFAVLPRAAYLGDTSYPVVAQQGGWYQVLLAVRRGLPSQVGPAGVNEATGGVRAADVTTSTTDLAIRASLSAGTVQLLRGGQVIATSEAGHGRPSTPTPITRTFVMSIYPDPTATYSRLFVTFGAHSPTLDSFLTGPAPIAIHVYPTHSGAISNGCLRIPADMLDTFAAVPLGTPVLITA